MNRNQVSHASYVPALLYLYLSISPKLQYEQKLEINKGLMRTNIPNEQKMRKSSELSINSKKRIFSTTRKEQRERIKEDCWVLLHVRFEKRNATRHTIMPRSAHNHDLKTYIFKHTADTHTLYLRPLCNYLVFPFYLCDSFSYFFRVVGAKNTHTGVGWWITTQ